VTWQERVIIPTRPIQAVVGYYSLPEIIVQGFPDIYAKKKISTSQVTRLDQKIVVGSFYYFYGNHNHSGLEEAH
jgi:hypothetical protein